MRRRQRIVIAFWLRVVTVHRGFEISCAEGVRRALYLREIDGHAFAGTPAVEQRRNHQGWRHDETEMIRIHSLTADGTALLGMIPQISHARERREIESPSAVAALRPLRAKARQLDDDEL